MNKAQLISKIKEFEAYLIWEIDNPNYYPFICWDGRETNWLTYVLEEATFKTLKLLYRGLKKL